MRIFYIIMALFTGWLMYDRSGEMADFIFGVLFAPILWIIWILNHLSHVG